jgi:hypothetical protein
MLRGDVVLCGATEPCVLVGNKANERQLAWVTQALSDTWGLETYVPVHLQDYILFSK